MESILNLLGLEQVLGGARGVVGWICSVLESQGKERGAS
jgi:hypothetical protein